VKKIRKIIKEELLNEASVPKEAIKLADEQADSTNDTYLVIKDKLMAKSNKWDTFGAFIVANADDLVDEFEGEILDAGFDLDSEALYDLLDVVYTS
jgi:hypothetical protein